MKKSPAAVAAFVAASVVSLVSQAKAQLWQPSVPGYDIVFRAPVVQVMDIGGKSALVFVNWFGPGPNYYGINSGYLSMVGFAGYANYPVGTKKVALYASGMMAIDQRPCAVTPFLSEALLMDTTDDSFTSRGGVTLNAFGFGLGMSSFGLPMYNPNLVANQFMSGVLFGVTYDRDYGHKYPSSPCGPGMPGFAAIACTISIR